MHRYNLRSKPSICIAADLAQIVRLDSVLNTRGNIAGALRRYTLFARVAFDHRIAHYFHKRAA
jgi:hypothetical protein